jgi:hypothetical protein
MKRLHVHVSVADLGESVRFYSALFAADPVVIQADYAKWMLDDPRVNFAISQRGVETARLGVDHLGVQVETDGELQEMRARLGGAELQAQAQTGTSCCYAKSDKYWTVDPTGIAWESFRTLSSIPTYGQSRQEAMGKPLPADSTACCTPNAGELSGAAATCGATSKSACC